MTEIRSGSSGQKDSRVSGSPLNLMQGGSTEGEKKCTDKRISWHCIFHIRPFLI